VFDPEDVPECVPDIDVVPVTVRAPVPPFVIVTPLIEVAVATPIFGVTNVGEVANTATPLPVSSVNAPVRFAEVKEPRDVAFPTEVIAPVKLAFVVTVPAVRDAAVPVNPVPLPENPVLVNIPVEGMNDSFVDVVFCGRLPVFAVTHVG
jgi:hypothetical protein